MQKRGRLIAGLVSIAITSMACAQCWDSDYTQGGFFSFLDYFFANKFGNLSQTGVVTYAQGPETRINKDYCLDPAFLVEYYCEDPLFSRPYPDFIIIRCPGNCSEGRCVILQPAEMFYTTTTMPATCFIDETRSGTYIKTGRGMVYFMAGNMSPCEGIAKLFRQRCESEGVIILNNCSDYPCPA